MFAISCELMLSLNMSKKTILIYGISSFLGSNLAEFLKKDYRIVGTYHKTKVSLDGILTIPCDVLAVEEVQLTLYAFKPDIVIYQIVERDLGSNYTVADML